MPSPFWPDLSSLSRVYVHHRVSPGNSAYSRKGDRYYRSEQAHVPEPMRSPQTMSARLTRCSFFASGYSCFVRRASYGRLLSAGILNGFIRPAAIPSPAKACPRSPAGTARRTGRDVDRRDDSRRVAVAAELHDQRARDEKDDEARPRPPAKPAASRRRRQVPHDRILLDAVGGELAVSPLPFRAVEGHLGLQPKPAQTRWCGPNTVAEESEPAVGVIVEGGLDGTAVAGKNSPAAPLL